MAYEIETKNTNGADPDQVANNPLPLPEKGKLLTREDVAQRLNVCTHTVQRLTRRGKLRAIYFNSRLVRYKPEDVDAFVSSAEVEAVEA